ncbi:Toprim and DNA topoisomerase domain containing protein, protein [Aphelenchoides bicaudatus]|nr:Toprim and DNA topoisomerase domain containing protein, protein [Aphelenchoides bicaudatus]
MTKMDQVKSEINVNDDEYIDVSGEDPEVQHMVASDPHIMRTTRFRRPRRPVEAAPYTPYSRRIITRNAHQQLAGDLDDDFEEEIVEEAEEESRMFNNPEIELEIASDVALVQRARTKRFNRDDEYSDFGPVQFRFDSTQRKKQVIVYNSLKFPGHASEWYFARRNNTTANETYRCVQCRRYREEFKKGIRQDVENLPEARIVVQNDRFLTDPDEPLGKHICDFENNERTSLQSVWSRRALSKANSELRLRPEKPKEKFNQLLREIQNGKDYAHLPVNVRQAIINELDSKKGFASRRRSFARNNRFGQMQTVGPIKDGIMRGGVYGEIMYYSCGMDGCKERFDSPEERKQHRNYYHSNVLFIDTKEELDEYNNYRRLNSNFVSGEELIVANEQVVREDQIKNEAAEPYQEVIIDDEEGENFYHQSCYAIESLRNSAIALVNDPVKRETMLALINDCERSCREIAQTVIDEEVVEQNSESKLPEEAIEEVETSFKLLFSRVLRMVNRKILCVAEKNDAAKNIAIILSNSRQVFRNGPAQYNKLYCFDTVMLGHQSSVVFTSVSGHLKQIDFPANMKAWERVPISSCFDAQISSYVPTNMKPIEEQLKSEVRNAHALIIWTDCDREGEHIGGEIVEVCRSVRPSIPVYRARFSEITRQAVTNALNRLVQMNQNEINAVSCRMELDLRIGAAFTRLQTILVQRQVPNALNGTQDRIVSYGSCQFPTMGFVVYRYLEHIGFAPENFWKLVGRDLDEKVDFTWVRQRLFDEEVVRVCF